MSGFTREFEIFVSKDLDPVAQAADFARRAREGVAADIAAGRVPPNFKRYVDGREGAPETSVRPGGVIAYEFSFSAEIVVFALAFLEARSPTGPMPSSGPRLYRKPYRESFYVGIDGRFIPPGGFRPYALRDDWEEIVIGNVQPYSRKVDVQQIGKRRLRFNAEPGLFQDCARALNRQFGNFAQARRVYTMKFPGQYKLQQTQFRTGERSHNVKRWAGTLVESPAIIISRR
jgi:hypothetical protein